MADEELRLGDVDPDLVRTVASGGVPGVLHVPRSQPAPCFALQASVLLCIANIVHETSVSLPPAVWGHEVDGGWSWQQLMVQSQPSHLPACFFTCSENLKVCNRQRIRQHK